MKIGIIAPYQGLKEVAEKVSSSHRDITIAIQIADLEEAIEPARQLEADGFQVLISRGGTARILREHSSLPVVEIDVSGYDILRTLLLIKDAKDPIELIGFPNVCHGINQVAHLLDTTISYQTIHSQLEVDTAVKDAINRGIQIVVGDTVTITTAKRFGVEGIMISSGPESVEQALFQAKEIGQVILQQHSINSGYQRLFNTLPEAIVLLTEKGNVTFSNQAFQNLFHMKAGQHLLSEHIPELYQFHRELLNYSFLQHTINYQGRIFIVEGETLHQGKEKLYFLKFSDETRYAIDQKGLSLHPLRSDIVSFGQISAANEHVHKTLETAKRDANSVPLFFIQGENGTGKRSLAMAIHHYRTNHTENQWLVSLNYEFDEAALERLNTIFATTAGTFYIKGWERIGKKQLTSLLDTASTSPATCLFATVQEQLPETVNPFLNQATLLTLPPLRERLDHLQEYIRTFIARSNNKHGKQIVGVKEGLLTEWKTATWPGNLEELQHTIEQGVQASDGPFLGKEDVEPVQETGNALEHHLDLTQPLEQIEKQIIEYILEQENMNQTQAAKRLGINRSTLWRKLKED
ncbi:sigma-54-dependent Fis family transcriptional regulator [Salsuginibacillus kocurii]|uniref:sigma-54-dependent Fis family transcriptional regulator n=1 Tax=Salsuginibacillus kocurii TaxID=427078 RepID=UPI0003669A04|nr:sigma-54-dependent Fis family transcriptional regulator [Salsuginibacillus kocurii]